MSDDQELLTIGRLSRRTGMPARTIRHWSDIGALPPTGRSGGGHRLYDAASVARLETTVTAVAVVHVEALDARIRTLRLRSAVLGTVAKRQSDTEEMTLLNQSARLSADERRRIVEEFVNEVFEGWTPAPTSRPVCGAPPPTSPVTPRPSR